MEETTTTTRYKTLSNGAVYDMEQKRIVSGATLSSVEASALRAKRTERRRQVIKEAANSAVQRADFKAYGDLAFLAEIAYNAQLKATNIEDPKMIEAARWLARESGESEELDKGGSEVGIEEVRGLLRDMAEAAREVARARQLSEVNE